LVSIAPPLLNIPSGDIHLIRLKMIMIIVIISFIFYILLLKNKYNNLIKISNHRIKNDLGIIMNIINIKKILSNEPEILDDLINKVLIISEIHEKIYESCNIALIEFDIYIKDIINTTNKFYDDNIIINYNINKCKIKTKFAVDLALIIQEYFVNAINLAYENINNKIFNLSLIINSHNYIIKMSTNGINFNKFNLDESNFKFAIIQNIIKQHNGKIQYTDDEIIINLISFY